MIYLKPMVSYTIKCNSLAKANGRGKQKHRWFTRVRRQAKCGLSKPARGNYMQQGETGCSGYESTS